MAGKLLRRVPVLMVLAALGWASPLAAQQGATSTPVTSTADRSALRGETTEDYNQRIAQLAKETKTPEASSSLRDYQIGPEDLLEISVLEAPDLNRSVRVTDDGAISLALLGSIQVNGLSTRELQAVLEDRLRHTYMKDPQVSVFVQEMRSHPVSVFGAVEKPGVYQIRYAKTLVEILSMAQGLANDAGDTVIIIRHQGATPAPALASLSGSGSGLTTDHPVGIAIPSPDPSGMAISEPSGTES